MIGWRPVVSRTVIIPIRLGLGPRGRWPGRMMPIALRRVIAPVIIIAIPGTWPRVGQHHIGAQSAVKIGGQDGGLDPGPTRGVIVITPHVVIVDARGRVIEVVVTPRPVIGVVGRGSDHAAIQPDDGRQAGHDQETTSDRQLVHWVISFLTRRCDIQSDALSICPGSPYCQDAPNESLLEAQSGF